VCEAQLRNALLKKLFYKNTNSKSYYELGILKNGLWCNGSTTGFGSVSIGSNPVSPTFCGLHKNNFRLGHTRSARRKVKYAKGVAPDMFHTPSSEQKGNRGIFYCLHVGIGRQGRLKIFCSFWACGFKSHWRYSILFINPTF
jgi:hypothetical protein